MDRPQRFPSLMLAHENTKDKEFRNMCSFQIKHPQEGIRRNTTASKCNDKGCDCRLGFCQPRDIKWTRVKRGWGPNILDFTYYNGKVYCYGMGNIIYAWDVHRKDQTVVKISVVPKDFYYGTIAPKAYLIGMDDGERKRLLVLIRKGVIKGNSIYFTDDAYFKHGLRGNGKCRDMGIYHLSDGTIDPYFNGVSLSHITPPIWLQSM
ncbi:hypothetical protein Tco_1485087 [Tanacetum coccineum]